MFFPINAMGMCMMPLCLFDTDSPQPTDEATQYVEGRPIRFEIRKKDDIEAIKKLAAIKMAP